MEVLTPFLGMNPAELETRLVEMGEPRYRGRQVFRWMTGRGARSFDDMTDLSLELRERLKSAAVIGRSQLLKWTASNEEGRFTTRKALVELHDGQKVETVHIPEPDRSTVCVSSQVGCAVACQFCATGWMGFRRHLSAGEILEQVAWVRGTAAPITHVVFMGMGEPFLNYDQVLRAAEILTHADGFGFGTRHVTISTSGIIPKIIEYADSRQPYPLAISLNATTEDVRSELMPITKKYPLEELLAAIRYYVRKMRRKVTLEYVLLAGVNDSDADAKRLVKIAGSLEGAKINVIPYNPIMGPDLKRPSQNVIERFMKRVAASPSPLTLRRSRGDDIMAACGQLAVQS